MFSLFDVTARQARLIELMFDNKTYYPAKFYAKKLNVSERTIFNDLDKLDDLFKKCDIKVVKKPNQGIKLTGEKASSELYYQLMKKNVFTKNDILYSSMDRQIRIAKWLLLENKTLTYYSLSLELYCSSSTIQKDFEQIQYFMDDGIRLVSDVKGTRVKGNEIGIQRTLKRFAYHVLNQKLHNYSDPSYSRNLEALFEKEIIDCVDSAMEELISVLGNDTTEQYLKSLFIFLLILTERSSKGFHITSLPQVDWKREESLSNYPVAVQVGNQIASHLNFTFTELEIQHISNQLFAHRIEVKLNNKYIENLLEKDIRSIIVNVSSAMGIDLTNDNKLYDSLTYHMFPLIYRLKTNIEIHNPLLEEIKNNYSTLFQMVWYAMENFENKYDIKMSENEITFLTIYFQAAIERRVQMREVLVICQTGIVTSDLIMNRIRNLLPVNIQFKLIAKPKLQYEDVSNVDFIISSVKLRNEPRPVVYVSPIIKERDLMNIYAYYLKYSVSKSSEKKKEVQPGDTCAYLNDSYIFLNETMTDKKKCLDKMINQFEQNHIVTSAFRRTVYERESLGNTVIQGNIATPHGNKSEVNQTKIAMMLTKKPLKWNHESQVSLIILLAVTEQDMNHIRQLLAQLFRNILALESIESYLKDIEKPEQLMELFTL